MDDFWFAVIVGFMAQLIDGSLGMAYGISASSLLLFIGIPPAAASATVHTAEVFVTGASALSHHKFGNIDHNLFRKLAVPGVAGAVSGALILSWISGDFIKPYVSFYLLLMGLVVLLKAFRPFVPGAAYRHLSWLGFSGAFLDTIGGGGWGPIVTSTLMARGNNVRMTIGSVNASEFVVTLVAALTFSVTLGLAQFWLVLGLATGGVLAAPIAAYFCKHIPVKPMMVAVGILIVFLSLKNMELI